MYYLFASDEEDAESESEGQDADAENGASGLWSHSVIVSMAALTPLAIVRGRF